MTAPLSQPAYEAITKNTPGPIAAETEKKKQSELLYVSKSGLAALELNSQKLFVQFSKSSL